MFRRPQVFGDDGVSQRQTSSGRLCCKYYEKPQFTDLRPSITGKFQHISTWLGRHLNVFTKSSRLQEGGGGGGY